MKKRIIAVLLMAVLALATLASCGQKAENTEAEAENTAEKVVVVTAGTGEPYSLLSDDGQTWTGIDAEMWDEIAKRTGWEVELKQAAFDSLWGELDTERADVAANCFAVKEERTDKYNATIPYYGDEQNVIINTADAETIKSFEDLKGMVVGCTNGQAAQTIIEDLGKEYGFEVKLYEDSNGGMGDLKLGRINAYANTKTNINAFLHANEDADFTYLGEKLMANNVAYFLPKTERGEQLKAELDKVLEEMINDGTVGKITEKWMYADMTQFIQK